MNAIYLKILALAMLTFLGGILSLQSNNVKCLYLVDVKEMKITFLLKMIVKDLVLVMRVLLI